MRRHSVVSIVLVVVAFAGGFGWAQQHGVFGEGMVSARPAG